jgi:CHAT domain-containing protein/tetratricopeptide (TPR) repeat protein
MRLCRARWAGIVAQLVLCAATAQDNKSTLEARAAEAFDKRDCVTASQLYTAALEPAKSAHEWGKASLYYRRIGICAYRAGDIDAAFSAYSSGVTAAESSHDEEMLIENLHGTSVAQRHLGRLADAMGAAERALVLAEKCQHPPHLSRAYSQISLLAADMGQLAKSQEYLQRMLDYARATHDREGETTATENLALHYGFMGDPETGIRLLKQALAQTPANDTVATGRFQGNLAALTKLTGRYAEAEAIYYEALANSQQPESWRNRQAILYNLGLLYVDRGNLTQARKSFEDCLKIVEKGRDPNIESNAKEALASVLLDLKQTPEALRVTEDAVDAARRSQSPAALFAALGTLGRAYDAAGKHAEAGAALEEALVVVESMRAAAPGDPVALEAVLRDGHPVFQEMVSHLLAAGKTEQALIWAEKGKARVLNDLVLKGHLDERTVMTEPEQREERRLYAAVSRTAADRKRSIATISELETFRRELYIRHPELALQRADFATGTLTEWRKLLPGRRSALIDFFQLRDDLAVFLIREQDVRVVRLKKTAAVLTTEIRAYRDQLAARDVNYTAAARSLYRDLLSPIVAALPGVEKWVLSPDSVLWELPFHTLLAQDGKPLIESHAVSYAPSLTALWTVRQREQKSGSAALELLAVGNPALPQAEDEVRQIAQMYGAGKAVALTGADARQDRFRDQAPRAAIIHIATHAQLNAANPMYSALALNPGTLPASEILRMPLHARLAVLSACETGRGKTAQGEELLGMGWALTGAGAAASIVSHWKVDSAATESLMVALHRNLRKSLPAAEALRQAELEVRAQQGNRNPFYWAAFMVLGDGFR